MIRNKQDSSSILLYLATSFQYHFCIPVRICLQKWYCWRHPFNITFCLPSSTKSSQLLFSKYPLNTALCLSNLDSFYCSLSPSYGRQQDNRPHTPDIFKGFNTPLFCFTVFTLTGIKSRKKVVQQQLRPQEPIPPNN